MKLTRVLGGAAAALGRVAAHDLTQKQHAILRNFPVIGHLRYWLETIGPELRQYIVTGNDEERPFSRDQRRWVYASAKQENNYFGFGTDNDIEHVAGLPIIKHRTFAASRADRRPRATRRCPLPSAKVLGGAARPARRRSGPTSMVNISGMSFGSLSGNAIEALNRGAALAGCLQNTGEGGDLAVPPPGRRHRLADRHGVLRLPRRGRAASTSAGSRSWSRRRRSAPSRSSSRRAPSPGSAACCRRAKVSQEIAEIRGIPMGEDWRQPVAAHGVPRRRQHARLRRAGRRRDRAAGRHQVRGRRHAASGTTLARLMAGARPRRRLRHHRRRRGRHRRGAAGLRRLRGAAVQGRLRPRLRARSPRPGLTDDVTFIGARQARPARERRRGLRARRRHGQRRPRGDAVDRLHPGAAVPHRPLPDRRRDAEPWLTRGLDPTLKSVRPPTTSRPCAATCSRSPRRSASPTRA